MKKETVKTTTNSKVYKILKKKALSKKLGLCFICGYHTGCNFWNKNHKIKNWKQYRKLQWKITQVGEGDSLLNC